MGFDIEGYLRRVGIDAATSLPPNVGTLEVVMAAQMRAIPFENIDVVLGERISMSLADVENKLVVAQRGGYCFEQNVLLQAALQSLGFQVQPILCRVRWGKAPDECTAFTHMALRVLLDGREYLSDVGFAGTNSIAPVLLGTSEPQLLPEGLFRTVADADAAGYVSLQLQVGDGCGRLPGACCQSNRDVQHATCNLQRHDMLQAPRRGSCVCAIRAAAACRHAQLPGTQCSATATPGTPHCR
jgi:N-hydroxyarylamine O-acetyltransferase